MKKFIMASPAQKQKSTQLAQPIHCFYHCPFTTTKDQIMEQYYQEKHYPKAKEVYHA